MHDAHTTKSNAGCFVANSSQSILTPLRWRLRTATQPDHERVEAHFGFHARTPCKNEYRHLLESLWGFYRPVEHALAQIDWRDCGICVSERSKVRWLEDDLLHLGSAPDAFSNMQQCVFAPKARSIPEGLGVLYVLEGATLGGQLIIRQLGPGLGIGPKLGGRFFASYGRNVGQMWRSYIEALERAGCDDADCETIERTAVATFQTFQSWFELRSAAAHFANPKSNAALRAR
ncbi:MAG: biliverdin-producing heme oxygenase [Hyphomicrobium sp.]